jgi:hypothetical protein
VRSRAIHTVHMERARSVEVSRLSLETMGVMKTRVDQQVKYKGMLVQVTRRPNGEGPVGKAYWQSELWERYT